MLTLSRKIGEKIVIGDDVVVTVLEIRGNKVRLGITAPDAVRVDRSEKQQQDETVWGSVPACNDELTRGDS